MITHPNVFVFYAVLIIFAAIPVSVIGTFVVIMDWASSINVISTRIGFCCGYSDLVTSIMSLENIFRLRQRGIDAQMRLIMVLVRFGDQFLDPRYRHRFCSSLDIGFAGWTIIS